MGLASVIHPGMPRVSLPPKWTRLQLSHHHILTISTPTGLSLSHSLRVYYYVLQYSLDYKKKSFWIWILQSVIIVAEPNIFLLLAPEEPSRRIIYLPQVNFMWSRFTCSLIFNSNSIFVTLKEFINHWLNFMLIGFQQINCVCESWYFYIFAFNLLIYDKLGQFVIYRPCIMLEHCALAARYVLQKWEWNLNIW